MTRDPSSYPLINVFALSEVFPVFPLFLLSWFRCLSGEA